VLRWLALTVELDNLEAGVLLPIIPNLPRLLGRPVPVAPELDAPSMQARLLEVVERILLRQEQPLVLLLEDLQWSQSDSLKMLEAVLHLTQSLPLMMVATYRDDESPSLPEWLSSMRTIRLERLDKPAIEQLAVAMIGE